MIPNGLSKNAENAINNSFGFFGWTCLHSWEAENKIFVVIVCSGVLCFLTLTKQENSDEYTLKINNEVDI